MVNNNDLMDIEEEIKEEEVVAKISPKKMIKSHKNHIAMGEGVSP
jgi:hypothetical protein